GRSMQALSFSLDQMSVSDYLAPSIKSVALRTAQPSVGLSGRIVLRRGRDLIIEILLDRLLEWVPSRAKVVWDDGTRRLATIDAGGTTRHGVFHSGQVIRLALRLATD